MAIMAQSGESGTRQQAASSPGEATEAATSRGDEPAGQPAAMGRSYTVTPGDTLSHIAQRFYNDASQWQKIFEANRDKIPNPDLIHPGQELFIP